MRRYKGTGLQKRSQLWERMWKLQNEANFRIFLFRRTSYEDGGDRTHIKLLLVFTVAGEPRCFRTMLPEVSENKGRRLRNVGAITEPIDHYSCRSATNGSTRAARRAGMYAASDATTIRNTEAARNTAG